MSYNAKYFHEQIEVIRRDINDLQRKVARGMVHKQPLLDKKIAQLQSIAALWSQGKDQSITRSTARVVKTAIERMQGPAYTRDERGTYVALTSPDIEPRIAASRSRVIDPEHGITVSGTVGKRNWLPVQVVVDKPRPYDPRPEREAINPHADAGSVRPVELNPLYVTVIDPMGKRQTRKAKHLVQALDMVQEYMRNRIDFGTVEAISQEVRGKTLACADYPDGSSILIRKA